MAERAGGVRSNASLEWKQRDHSLFVAFAPVEAPRYAMGCIVEHGGFGASAAAPLVRDAMTYLFDPAKAMETLEAQEAGWGGDIKTRMAAKRAGWIARAEPGSAPPALAATANSSAPIPNEAPAPPASTESPHANEVTSD